MITLGHYISGICFSSPTVYYFYGQNISPCGPRLDQRTPSVLQISPNILTNLNTFKFAAISERINNNGRVPKENQR